MNGSCGDKEQKAHCDSKTNKCPKPMVDLSVTVTHDPDPAIPDSPITYQINVHNLGNSTAPGPVVATYTVPAGGTITQVSPGPGWRCMVTDRTVTCTLSTPLPVGDAPPIKILVTPTPSSATGGGASNGPGGVQISVMVSSDGSTDPNPANNTYGETTSLAAYRVAGGGFGCALVRDSAGVSMGGAALMALGMLLAMRGLRRRRRMTS